MKILISPSKTQRTITKTLFEPKDLQFKKEHKIVLSTLKKLQKEELKTIMKIDGALLDQTYQNIRKHNTLNRIQAFTAFDGLVYKGLNIDLYDETHLQYIEKHIRILDALYGVLEPGTMIKPYRLDLKMNIGFSLYKFWDISEYFKGETIVNLASDEFSKMVQKDDMIEIQFLQYKDGRYINQATYTKQARGIFLNYMIENHITELKQLKQFQMAGYQFHEALSNSQILTFTR